MMRSAQRSNGGVIGAYVNTTQSSAPGMWSVNHVAPRAARNLTQTNGVWPSANDPSFASVVFLCHFEAYGPESTGSAAIADVIGRHRMIIGAGGVGLSSDQAKFGQFSYRNGNSAGDALWNASNISDFAFGTSDFTVEGWFYLNQLTNTQVLLDFRSATGSFVTPNWYVNTSNKLVLFVNGADRIVGTTSVTINAWHYWAYSRIGTSGSLYLDGNQEGTLVDSNNYVASGFFIGNQPTTGAGVNPTRGYIDEMRITNGVGRYSGATITVPTKPFPDY